MLRSLAPSPFLHLMCGASLSVGRMDTKKDTQLADETTCLLEKYKLPDGRVLKFDRERFEAAEVLFTPPDGDILGVADMLYVACCLVGSEGFA